MSYDARKLVIAQAGVPCAIPSSGSVGANGALTLTTALLLTYANIWLYFPAGAVYANSPAGMYFCQMSSTTLGTIYNNLLSQYTSVTSAIPPSVSSSFPYIPPQLNPIVAAGPGAYTQTTGSALQVAACLVPGGSLGNNGSVEAVECVSWANNGNNKIFATVWGGQTWKSVTRTTNASAVDQKILTNRGVANSQVASPTGSTGYGVTSSGSPLALTQDTGQNVNVAFTGQLATATDFMVWDSIRVTVDYGA